MPEMIEIEGALARIVTREVRREVALKDLIPMIETRVQIDTPILPTRTRKFSLNPVQLNNWRIHVLVEVAPLVREISIYHERKTLSMPWTYFMYTFRSENQGQTWQPYDAYIYFAKQAVTSDADTMIPALLPNISSDGNICFGSGLRNYGDALAPQIDGRINDFWLSDFTHSSQDWPWPGRHNTSTAWERMTERDPGGWANWGEFDPDNATLGRRHHKYTVEELFTRAGINRNELHVTEDAIPELRVAPTFGMAQQYWANLEPLQRTRLRRGLELFLDATPEGEEPFEPEPVLFAEDENAEDEELF